MIPHLRRLLDHVAWTDRRVLAAARSLADRARSEYGAFLASLAEADVTREVAYRDTAGREHRQRLGDPLLHVALHGAYHRGQIAARLRDSGAEPVNTDYIAFLRAGAPCANAGATPPR
jgi:uncharacterized damage-inducible protein DinB